MNAWRDELRGILSTVASTTEWPDLVGEVSRAQEIRQNRLLRPVRLPDKMLTAAAVAEQLGMSVKWVYRNQEKLGAEKHGSAVRFSLRAVERYRVPNRGNR